MRYTLISLVSFLTTLNALTITSPSAGAVVDPSKPITVTWTSTPSDPSTFNLNFSGPSDSTFNGEKQVGTNIQTSAGSFTIPANTIAAFGAGFTFTAKSLTGNSIGTSSSLILGYVDQQIVTGANNQISILPGAQSTALSSIVFDTSGVTGSMTATYFPSTNITPSGATSSPTSLVFTTGSVTGSMTIQPSASGASSSRTASVSPASTVNAQPRVAVGKDVVAAAGAVAGFVALFA